jgi:hypothetical protein
MLSQSPLNVNRDKVPANGNCIGMYWKNASGFPDDAGAEPERTSGSRKAET